VKYVKRSLKEMMREEKEEVLVELRMLLENFEGVLTLVEVLDRL
jgi:hypothetical protein